MEKFHGADEVYRRTVARVHEEMDFNRTPAGDDSKTAKQLREEHQLKEIALRMGNIALCCVKDGLVESARFYADGAAHFANLLLKCEELNGRA